MKITIKYNEQAKQEHKTWVLTYTQEARLRAKCVLPYLEKRNEK